MRKVAAACVAGALWWTSACGAEALPGQVAGTWGTGASLYDGTGPQSELYLLPGGQGMLAGSSSAPVRMDGKDDGKRAPRAIIGMPVLAIWQDGVLVVNFHSRDPRDAAKAAYNFLACSVGEQGATLTCRGPAGDPLVLKRRAGTVPDDVAREIAKAHEAA